MRYKDIENYTDPSKCCLTLLKMSGQHTEGVSKSDLGVTTFYYVSVNNDLSQGGICITQFKNGSPRDKTNPVLYFESNHPKQTYQEFLDDLFFGTLSTELKICKGDLDTVIRISLEKFLNYLPYKTWEEYKRVYRSLFESNTEHILHKMR